jgi:hypothetical protein
MTESERIQAYAEWLETCNDHQVYHEWMRIAKIDEHDQKGIVENAEKAEVLQSDIVDRFIARMHLQITGEPMF